jgi:hypothetical protein
MARAGNGGTSRPGIEQSAITRREFRGARPAALNSPIRTAAAELERKRLLSAAWPLEKLGSALLAADEWRPFLRAADRGGWQASGRW